MLVYLGVLFVLGWLGWWILFWGIILFTVFNWTIVAIWKFCESIHRLFTRRNKA